MAILTISEAARRWRIGRTTVQRAIREGRLSATIQPNGGKGIDSSEMVRCFGEPRIDAGSDAGASSAEDAAIQADAVTSSQSDAPQFVAAMQAQIDLLKDQLADARERELWLRRQLEDVQRLLPAPQPPQPQSDPPRHHHRLWTLLLILVAAVAALVWTRGSAWWLLG